MVFSSTLFLLFFLPVVLVGIFLMKREYQNSFLLVCSLIFYAWGEPRAVIILVASITLNYFFGLLITYQQKSHFLRKSFFIFSIICNLGILFYYKYLLFFITQLGILGRFPESISKITLPIGISFYTFQAMSYIVDLYKGKVSVQKDPTKLALYVCLFPQLIAGPIVRYIDVANEIDCRTVSTDDVKQGIMRFIIGLSKKVLIANNVAIYADLAFSMPQQELSVEAAWLGILCYTLQIYFDFSGYSDMAIGIGRMIGFHFLENFKLPYVADSMQDFWRRWHISLSTWFRDYLYIPLGGNQKGKIKTYINLLIVFSLCGFWHGAGWTFLIWGLFHGFFLVLERISAVQIILTKTPNLLRRIYCFTLVMIGWVFFRANTFSLAVDYIQAMFGNCTGQGFFRDQISFSLIITACIVGMLFSVTKLPALIYEKYEKICAGKYGIASFLMEVGLVALLFLCIIRTIPQNYNPFIYFRF